MRKTMPFIAVLAALLILNSCNNPQPQTELEFKAQTSVKRYAVQDYNSDDYIYTPVSTTVTPLYDYTPFDITGCAEEISTIEWELENPTMETNHYALNTQLQQCYEFLYEMADTMDIAKTQNGYLVEHTYRITSIHPKLPYVTLSKTFVCDTAFNDVYEVYNQTVAFMLKRRDIIIDKAIEHRKAKK